MPGFTWLAGVAAIIGLLCNAQAWAADPPATTTTTTTHHRHHHHMVTTTTTTTVVEPTSEEQRLNALSGEVGNLQKQQDDTTAR